MADFIDRAETEQPPSHHWKDDVLENFLIVSHIIKYLEFKDLLSARLVSRVWNEAGSYMLNKRRHLLHICERNLLSDTQKHPSGPNEYIQFEVWRNQFPTHQSLKFNHVRIRMNWNQAALQQYLCGPWALSIKSLHLVDLTVTDCNSLIEPLLRALPQLEKLQTSIMYRTHEPPSALTGFNLNVFQDKESTTWKSGLKTLQIAVHYCNIPDIALSQKFLQFCPKLENVEYYLRNEVAIERLVAQLRENFRGRCLKSLKLTDWQTTAPMDMGSRTVTALTAHLIALKVEKISVGFAPALDSTVVFLQEIASSTNITDLSWTSVIRHEWSNQVSFYKASDVMRALAGTRASDHVQKLKSLKLIFPLHISGLDDRSFKTPFFRDPSLLQQIQYLRPLETVTKLEVSTFNRYEITRNLWSTSPKFICWFYEMIHKVFPNLETFTACPLDIEEFNCLMNQLQKLPLLRNVSLHLSFTRAHLRFLVETFFGDCAKYGCSGVYHGLGGLKHVQNLTLSGIDMRSITWKNSDLPEKLIHGLNKMPSLRRLELTVSNENMRILKAHPHFSRLTEQTVVVLKAPQFLCF